MHCCNWILSLLVFAVTILSFGCRGALEHEPGNLQVTVALDGSALQVLGAREVGELPNPPVTEKSLRFVFRPDDGAAPVEGAVEDNRLFHSEFDAEGNPDPQFGIADFGLVDVRVPATSGTLELLSEGGERLGEVAIDPEAPVTRRAALMNQDDILGAPVKVRDRGDSDGRIDILFLPEGYQEDELAEFHSHVDTITERLASVSGYRDHWDAFNVWRQDIRSRNSGTGTGGRAIGTAFDTAAGVSGLQRCVFLTNSAGMDAAKRLAADAGADVTVILVNSTDYGGCASQGVVVTARPRNVADVVAHELGHGLFGLADEYDSTRPNGSCTTGPNVAIGYSLDALPWADMVNTTELPTPPLASFGTVGAFEGAGYCARGRWRPTHNCLMRNVGVGMCPVCRREVARTVAALAPDSGAAPGVRVTNETGADLWVRCNGRVRSACSDWIFVEEGQTAGVLTPNRGLVLHNPEEGAAVTFELRRVIAPGDEVSVFANDADPFSRPGASTGSDSTNGGNGGTDSDDDANGGANLSAPEDLQPDLVVVPNQEVILEWGAVPGALRYKLTVEREDSSRWTSWASGEMEVTRGSVELAAEGARYRWQVTACNAMTCKTSLHAIFTFEGVATGGGNDSGGTTTNENTSAPAAPTSFDPVDNSVTADQTPTLKWNDVTGATHYNFAMFRLEPSSNSWQPYGPERPVDQSRVGATLDTPETWYGYRVQACNAVGCSAWSDYTRIYWRP